MKCVGAHFIIWKSIKARNLLAWGNHNGPSHFTSASSFFIYINFRLLSVLWKKGSHRTARCRIIYLEFLVLLGVHEWKHDVFQVGPFALHFRGLLSPKRTPIPKEQMTRKSSNFPFALIRQQLDCSRDILYKCSPCPAESFSFGISWAESDPGSETAVTTFLPSSYF